MRYPWVRVAVGMIVVGAQFAVRNEWRTATNNVQQSHEQQPQKHDEPQEHLPQCDEVMQAPNSPFFQNGAFITLHTTPIQWTLRADGSRQVDLNNTICHLKRYTAKEAKQCLSAYSSSSSSSSSSNHQQHDHNHHVLSFIGDSLTRYQYLSLVYFLEHDTFPPRFGNFRQPCAHVNESGHETCSPLGQPNVCMELDWRKSNNNSSNNKFGKRVVNVAVDDDPWIHFFSSLNGEIMNGHLECSCARTAAMKCAWARGSACATENLLYNNNNNIVLSYFKEDGRTNLPQPMHGFYFTNCSATGTCRRRAAGLNTMEQTLLLVNRSQNFDFDWIQPFPEAINTTGVLRNKDIGLPSHRRQPDIVIYNRGHWGRLTKERAKTIMPILYDWVNQPQLDQDGMTTARNINKKNGGGGGRCFFKSTTRANSISERSGIFEKEFLQVRPLVHEAGCEYLDYAHLTRLFGRLEQSKDWRSKGERGVVFWDAVHYMPWVYEELNQVLLNVLCNSKKLSE